MCEYLYLAASLDIAFSREASAANERLILCTQGLGLGLSPCISNACNKATFTAWLGNWPKAAGCNGVESSTVEESLTGVRTAVFLYRRLAYFNM